MVDQQLRARGIDDERILQAFLEVPREEFLPSPRRHQAYEDNPVPIGEGQTISQPYVVALTLQHLALSAEDRILDIGLGSGYQTALLAHLARHVYALERHEALAERAMATLARLEVTNVTAKAADGTLGWPEEAPFDGIVSGAASREVPEPWLDQLADGGRIVAPIGSPAEQTLTRIERHGDEFRSHPICPVRFVRLVGMHGWPEE